MIESFRAQARFEQIAIFDRNGVERFSFRRARRRGPNCDLQIHRSGRIAATPA